MYFLFPIDSGGVEEKKKSNIPHTVADRRTFPNTSPNTVPHLQQSNTVEKIHSWWSLNAKLNEWKKNEWTKRSLKILPK